MQLLCSVVNTLESEQSNNGFENVGFVVRNGFKSQPNDLIAVCP